MNIVGIQIVSLITIAVEQERMELDSLGLDQDINIQIIEGLDYGEQHDECHSRTFQPIK